ncbi:hypothetical protein V8E54_003293 [Elaphomyces granulatus]
MHSCRDSTKAEGQRRALGSPQRSVYGGQSFNLVVCGAINPKDGFIFSDFMGFCMALREHNVGGDFYSCFPIEKHFIWLRNEKSPPIDVIKFGKMGNKSKALYTYSRHAYLNREYWWEQIGRHELLEKVEKWIVDKVQWAEPGDVVNIILEGHGAKSGEYCIGDRRLHPYVFRDWVAKFRPGVQVNAISGACYSGAFVDAVQSSEQKDRYITYEMSWSVTRSVSNRIRNSRFSQAFVQSLAKLNLPGISRRKAIWHLQDHESFVRAAMRNVTPGSPSSNPQFYVSESLSGMTAVEELIFRDKISIVYDPRISSRRRRIEWPTVDSVVRDILTQPDDDPPPPEVSVEAKSVIEFELCKCDTRQGFIPDLCIFDEVYTKTPNWRNILRTLYWRARRQSAVWDVFELLVDRGFLHPVCLTIPVDLHKSTHASACIFRLLGCFSFISKDEDLALLDGLPLQTSAWDLDIKWLATMIIRSGVALEKLLCTIEASGFLGNCVLKGLESFKQSHSKESLSQDPLCDKLFPPRDGTVDRKDNAFGFWLPHGLDGEDEEVFVSQLLQCKERFNSIERAFREVECIPTDKLWLESEQVAFFEEHPEKLPGRERLARCLSLETRVSSPPFTRF